MRMFLDVENLLKIRSNPLHLQDNRTEFEAVHGQKC